MLTTSSRTLVALTAFGASLALGASNATAAMTASSQDSTFASKAAQGGLAEIAAARLALKNGSSPAVKAFAQKMITDHSKAGQQLMTIAKSEGMTLPTAPSAMQQAMAAKLSKLTGAAFDTAYLQGQTQGHEQMETVFQQEAASGKDPQLVAFAKVTLPTVKQHLALAQSDGSKMKSGAGSM